jgi:hypothetical protein
MTRRSVLLAVVIIVGSVALTARGLAQTTPAPRTAPRSAAATRPPATLDELMRGIVFINSNVIFAAQGDDPATVKPDPDPASATNPLASVYGGWQAVENSGLALAEAATLLTLPGRVCTNGKPVPVANADWQMFTREMRDAGLSATKAARAKNQDQILDAADKVTASCSDCHQVYRDKTAEQGGDAKRCTK